MREKRVKLFNKNHITLEHVTNCKKGSIHASWRDGVLSFPVDEPWYAITTESSVESNIQQQTREVYSWRHREKIKKVIIEKESPLGFYYKIEKEIDVHNLDKPKLSVYYGANDMKSFNRLTFAFGDEYYVLSYPTQYCSSRLSTEMRPWMLMDNHSMEDNFVNALLTEVTKLFDLIEEKKSVKLFNISRHSNTTYIIADDKPKVGLVGDTKRKVFTDLFGYPDGPKYQTNDEKILAAGFDLKTSFRNM